MSKKEKTVTNSMKAQPAQSSAQSTTLSEPNHQKPVEEQIQISIAFHQMQWSKFPFHAHRFQDGWGCLPGSYNSIGEDFNSDNNSCRNTISINRQTSFPVLFRLLNSENAVKLRNITEKNKENETLTAPKITALIGQKMVIADFVQVPFTVSVFPLWGEGDKPDFMPLIETLVSGMKGSATVNLLNEQTIVLDLCLNIYTIENENRRFRFDVNEKEESATTLQLPEQKTVQFQIKQMEFPAGMSLLLATPDITGWNDSDSILPKDIGTTYFLIVFNIIKPKR